MTSRRLPAPFLRGFPLLRLRDLRFHARLLRRVQLATQTCLFIHLGGSLRLSLGICGLPLNRIPRLSFPIRICFGSLPKLLLYFLGEVEDQIE